MAPCIGWINLYEVKGIIGSLVLNVLENIGRHPFDGQNTKRQGLDDVFKISKPIGFGVLKTDLDTDQPNLRRLDSGSTDKK